MYKTSVLGFLCSTHYYRQFFVINFVLFVRVEDKYQYPSSTFWVIKRQYRIPILVEGQTPTRNSMEPHSKSQILSQEE